MTPTKKRTVRLTPEIARDRSRYRQIVVIVGPGPLIAFRLKGTRKEYATTAGACYALAVKQHVAAEKVRKAEARSLKREAH